MITQKLFPVAFAALFLLTHVAGVSALDDAATKTKSGSSTKSNQGSSTKPAMGKTTSVSVFNEATLMVPADFKATAKRSRILDHEFQASAGQGDQAQTARVTMMASGGGVGPNIKRWKGQFTGGKAEEQKVETMQINGWNVHVAHNSGNFSERMGGGPFAPGKTVNRTDYAMTGAILENPKGRLYFVKMVGPMSVVKANQDAFMKMIKSIGEK